MSVIDEIKDLEEQILKLPKGTLVYKKINGINQPYLQQTINGKSISTYIKKTDREEILEQLTIRNDLLVKLKELKSHIYYRHLNLFPTSHNEIEEEHGFYSNVKIKDSLNRFIEDAKELNKRDCFNKLEDYLYGNTSGKVFVLYGLRRTGKTTLIKQALLNMKIEDLNRSAYIPIRSTDNLGKINFDLKYLESKGYKYIFIDEATLMEDFIEGAALFSDAYASSGMKIVLSGTDSLGFLFAKSDQLYDRCILLRTTFIPYHEFEKVLGIKGIDEYIRYGGTMSLSGVNYNEDSPFANGELADEYTNSAIAHNIQHSLKNYQYGGHFRALKELYNKGELTSAINRVVEDINHEFTIEVLTKKFQSNDLSISRKNLRKDLEYGSNILDSINVEQFTKRLKDMLEIKNKEEQSISIQESHKEEIKEYLELLDFIKDIPNVIISDKLIKDSRIVFTQPGMRYAQAEAFVKSIMEENVFQELSREDDEYILSRILNEIKGRMMEDIVLLETVISNPNKQVFKLQFSIGEFDMVVVDDKTLSCKIYEIKHSDQIVDNQYRFIIDENMCAKTEYKYGKISGRYVIYRGENKQLDNGVTYLNVEDYLNQLSYYENL